MTISCAILCNGCASSDGCAGGANSSLECDGHRAFRFFPNAQEDANASSCSQEMRARADWFLDLRTIGVA
jgi:hypothetical protein